MGDFEKDGFQIYDDIFTISEVTSIAKAIEEAGREGVTFRSNGGLFAIRQFLKMIPGIYELVFTKRFVELLEKTGGKDYFVVKSIYFDKPPESNWFVASHQDLTISIKSRNAVPGFGPWTIKDDQFAVQPPTVLLEDNITARIHLDETDEANGALLVVAGSHLQGVIDVKTYEKPEIENICKVKQGGVMIMKPCLCIDRSGW